MSNYNGWTNYETWLVNLWLGDIGEELARLANGSPDGLRDIIEEHGGFADALAGGGLLSDIVGAALGRVNWRELAETWAEDDDDEDDDEDDDQ